MDKIGKYEILEELGKGGMGVVYKAYDPLMQREVAIKVLSDWAFHQADIKERFYREARSSGQLTHENITIIHDLGEYEEMPYIVMEHLSGSDLRTILKSGKKLSLPEKLNYAKQICSGLAYSHAKGIIHRDIKPENVRVLENGKIKIMDFGIAKPTSTNTMTVTGTVMGTPFYMSPEQVRGLKVGPASDIFSFGVLLYEMMTNALPFPGDNPTTVSYKIVHEPPEPIADVELGNISGLQALILKCLDKEPDSRYQKFEQVRDDIVKIERRLSSATSDSKGKAAAAQGKLFEKKRKAAKKLMRKQLYSEAIITLNEILESAPDDEATLALLEEVKERIAQRKAARAAEAEQPAGSAKRLRARIPEDKKSPRQTFLLAAVAIIVLAAGGYFFFSGPSTPTGYVSLNIIPWAQIAAVHDSSGLEITTEVLADHRPLTPSRLRMPAGRFTISLVNPELEESLEVAVHVKQDETTTIKQRMPGFTHSEVVSNVLEKL